MTEWFDASTYPQDLNPCVVLHRNEAGLWERVFAQHTKRGWEYMGSDAKVRNVEYWFPLPALPKPTVKRE